MPSRTFTAVSAPRLLLAGGFCLVLIATGALAQSEPETVRLPGTVRDFQAAHPDFNETPSAGNGHYAGLVSVALADDDTPILTGAGFRVDDQWRDAAGNPIAPHLYGGGLMGGVTVTSSPTIDQGSYIDTWDSTQGPYGGPNVGPEPDIEVKAVIQPIAEPTSLGPNVGDVFMRDTHMINADIHCDEFRTRRDTVLNINGHVTIFCETQFFLDQRTVVNLLNDSTLRIYARTGFTFNRSTQVNMNTFDPYRCQIYNLGTGSVNINQGNQVCAQIYSPQGPLLMAQGDHIYGSFSGLSAELHQDSAIHVDGGQMTVCGTVLNDSEGAAGSASTAAITSADTFNHWYHDVLGENLSAPHSITLVRNASGIYEYLDDSFLPIDGRLFGNEGGFHNYLFTFTFIAEFTFNQCSEYFFEFEGADDAWVFVEGERHFGASPELGLDLGGVAPMTNQRVAMDRLGLIDGETYTMRFFYAQRQSNMAVFRVRTNIPLTGDESIHAVSAGWD